MAHYRLECTSAADTSTQVQSIVGDAINRDDQTWPHHDGLDFLRCPQVSLTLSMVHCRPEYTSVAGMSTNTSSTSRDTMKDELVSDSWFESLGEFISDEVKECFGQHTPPTIEQLCSPPLLSDLPGVYADALTPSASRL